MIAFIKLMFASLIILFGIVLGLSNTTPIAISIFNYATPELPFSLWLITALFLGVILTGLMTNIRLLRYKRDAQKFRSSQSQ